MAPPPKPPIICYDLPTNTNARRPLSSRHHVPYANSTRKTRVTVVQRDPNDLCQAKADSTWNYQTYHHRSDAEATENMTTREPPTIVKSKAPKSNCRDKVVRLNLSNPSKYLLDSEPYQFNAFPFDCQSTSTRNSKSTNANARNLYDQKLKHEAQDRKLRLEQRRRRLGLQAQLEEISNKLEYCKHVQEDMLEKVGMSHNAARFIRQLEEDLAKLRQKYDQSNENHRKELGRCIPKLRRIEKIQREEDIRAEERRLEGMSKSPHTRHTLSSTLNQSLSSSSPMTNTTTNNTDSTSSTISISSRSSSMSTDESYLPNSRYLNQLYSRTPIKKTLPTPQSLSTRPRSGKTTYDSSIASQQRPIEKFSFYKGCPSDEILEVTDIDFFEKVEDKTMIEVNELMKNLQSSMREMNRELNTVQE